MIPGETVPPPTEADTSAPLRNHVHLVRAQNCACTYELEQRHKYYIYHSMAPSTMLL